VDVHLSPYGSKRIQAIIVAIVVIAAASAAFVYEELPTSGNHNPNASICSSILSVKTAIGFAKANFNATKVSFLVVESDEAPFEGMNGSYYHTFPPNDGYNATLPNWPVIQVRQNQTVEITIVNCASSEPHGFAIGHYFNAGVTLREGQSYTLTFEASQVGKFMMYCNIFCSIHPYMQNGLLIVS
jgi:heme/copper-type cytochrome/quinol oxidase subunit 2